LVIRDLATLDLEQARHVSRPRRPERDPFGRKVEIEV
jgi:hypothetical protein